MGQGYRCDKAKSKAHTGDSVMRAMHLQGVHTFLVFSLALLPRILPIKAASGLTMR